MFKGLLQNTLNLILRTLRFYRNLVYRSTQLPIIQNGIVFKQNNQWTDNKVLALIISYLNDYYMTGKLSF